MDDRLRAKTCFSFSLRTDLVKNSDEVDDARGEEREQKEEEEEEEEEDEDRRRRESDDKSRSDLVNRMKMIVS